MGHHLRSSAGLPGAAPDDDPEAMVLTFDGGARLRGGAPCMGGAGLLRSGRMGGGDRRLVAEASAAVPYATSATEAEARYTPVSGTRRRVVYLDNLAVVRYGAA